jgi:hypothetical protein
MSLNLTRLACLALLFTVAAAPCRAESFASSASSAGSASSGSVSDSFEGSSDASSNKKVAEGDYRIIDVAQAPRPGMLRLRLQATAGGKAADEFFLNLPQQAFAEHGLAAGDVVSARQRPYGLEFARSDTRTAFFLVLADNWHRELGSNAVAL